MPSQLPAPGAPQIPGVAPTPPSALDPEKPPGDFKQLYYCPISSDNPETQAYIDGAWKTMGFDFCPSSLSKEDAGHPTQLTDDFPPSPWVNSAGQTDKPKVLPTTPLTQFPQESEQKESVDSSQLPPDVPAKQILRICTRPLWRNNSSEKISESGPFQALFAPRPADIEMNCVNQETSFPVEQTAKTFKAAAPTPYDIGQRLAAEERLLISGNMVYRFNGLYYQFCTSDDIKRFITGRCRAEVQLAGTANFVEQIYKCLLIEPNLCAREQLRPSEDHIVFQDGMLNLRTGSFEPHSPEIFTTSCLQAEYRRGFQSGCPLFDRFIESISLGNPLLIQRIWEVVGYVLTQDMRGKAFFVFQGPSNSGKSILGNFIRECCNVASVVTLELHSFGNNFALASLIGKRLCIDLDLPSGPISSKAVSYVKKMTGGDMLSTDIKYMPRASFMNSAQLVFATNHVVYTLGEDPAFNQRMVVVPFARSVPIEEQDPDLLRKLGNERSAIIAKALGYYQVLRNNHYRFSGNFYINATISETNCITDTILTFLKNSCCTAEGTWTATQELFRAFTKQYGAVCEMRVFSTYVGLLIRQVYPDAIRARDRIKGRGNPINGYQGICLKENLTPDL